MGRFVEQRLGKVNKNRFGSLMEIIEYNGANDIWVKFEKGKPVHTVWKLFINGTVRSQYDKTVHGVGYIGEGKYKVKENGKITPQYSTWSEMLRRCYDKNFLKRQSTYNGCIVNETWYSFQNFAQWYDENYYKIEKEKMCLDKDILIKGNKIYSSDTCMFVPHSINMLFVKCNAIRGNLPIGVHLDKNNNNYRAECSTGKGTREKLGSHNTPEEAFKVYKDFKEKYIKEVAEKYKNKIPIKLYEAMLRYDVNIND